jgi:hypothetical protein
MRELTQTTLHPAGNCWQTCVACILDIDPDLMPPQCEYDRREPQPDGGFKWVGPSYSGVLNRYLREHHGLAYVEMHLPEEIWTAIQLRADAPFDGYHMLTGRTIRSDAQDGARHVVVARNGKMVWDPHPSRSGLLEEIRYGLLVPFPESWKRIVVEPCVCPKCSSTS